MFRPEDLPVLLFTARRYEREVISRAPVSGVVLKLTDISEFTLDEAVEKYWQILLQSASIDAVALVATINNLVLDRQHDPEWHESVVNRFLRPKRPCSFGSRSKAIRIRHSALRSLGSAAC
jgi:hypothetical protein